MEIEMRTAFAVRIFYIFLNFHPKSLRQVLIGCIITVPQNRGQLRAVRMEIEMRTAFAVRIFYIFLNFHPKSLRQVLIGCIITGKEGIL